jgi:Carboxypeptidase regulatory-like domain
MIFRTCAVLALTIGLIAGIPASGMACSCNGSAGPPCEATWKADAVFAGTVRSIVEIAHDAYGQPWKSLLVTVDVERAFVNSSPGPLELITGQDGAACGYGFSVGQRYLIYALKTQAGRWSASICSRTRLLDKAQEDLQYLSTVPTARLGSRVFGHIHHWQRDPFEEQTVDYGPLEGIVVNVSGAGFSRDVVTDRHGRYEITGLPVGASAVTVAAPHGFDSRGLQRELDLRDPRACSERNFELRYVAGVSGTVVDAAGRAVAGIRIDAVAAELAGHQPQPYQTPAVTDAQGAFAFDNLPPGAYVFGVNLTKQNYGQAAKAPAVYLPGTRTAAEATIIVLNPGDRKDVGALRLDDR